MSNTCELPDIQNSKPKHNIPIKRVGIRNFKMPIYIDEQSGGNQHTVADIDVFVDLDAINKGINMSRLPIGIQLYKDKKLNATVIHSIAKFICELSEAQRCEIIYRFPYFLNKISPVTSIKGIIYYDIEFNLIYNNNNNQSEFYITVKSMGTSLCPCSKEISEHQGAHNQRSIIEVKCKTKGFLWIEDIIDRIESSYSCQIYSILKRPDEKKVTMDAYNNPKFVEDIGRELTFKLGKMENIESYEIKVSNQESIHQHDAYCHIKSIEK
jgi:GTP cyclohydrolase I